MPTPTNQPISTIVDVQITRQTAAPQQVDFGLMCFMVEGVDVIPVSERYRIYPDLDAVEADFVSTTATYKACAAFFGQTPSSNEVMIACVDTAASPTPETYTAALTDAYNKKSFYMVGAINKALTDTVVKEIATFVQAHTMMMCYATLEAGVLTTGTTDIAAELKALDRDRSIICFDENLTDDERFDAAFVGMGLPYAPGTLNWAFKTLSGVTATSSTATQIGNAQGKGANMYVQVGGVPITEYGTTCGATPTYIDQIQAIDWLKINIETAIYDLLIGTAKIPYTDAGVSLIKSAIAQILNQAVNLGIIAKDPLYTITSIPVSDVPVSQRAQRIAPDITFTARLAGAINHVVVRGTLSI